MNDGILQPKQELFTISVGGSLAAISGFDSQAIQLALDVANSYGGGVVKLGAGVFEVLGPIRLYDNITLKGEGAETVLRKVNGFKTPFVEDADYGELRVVVSDSSTFRKGMGIQLYDSNSRDGWNVSTAIVTAVEGDTVHFDRHLINDYVADFSGTVSTACSIVEGVQVQNVKVENLVIDGNKENSELINGCRGGGIYFHKSSNCTVKNVKVMDFNGDGVSWQITEHISIRNCEIQGCTNFGLHPGTGSYWTVVDGCDCHDNGSDGIYICWRVQNGVFHNNAFHHNGGNGISIGHKDVNNLFDHNRIYQNADCGILIRVEKYSNGAHGNTFIQNIIEDNGNAETGYGVLVSGVTRGLTFESNVIRDSGRGIQKTGIRILENVTDVTLVDNQLSSHVEGDIVSENGTTNLNRNLQSNVPTQAQNL